MCDAKFDLVGHLQFILNTMSTVWAHSLTRCRHITGAHLREINLTMHANTTEHFQYGGGGGEECNLKHDRSSEGVIHIQH